MRTFFSGLASLEGGARRDSGGKDEVGTCSDGTGPDLPYLRYRLQLYIRKEDDRIISVILFVCIYENLECVSQTEREGVLHR